MEPDPLEVSLEDPELQAEVEMLTDLIVAASDHVEHSLDQEHVDEVLGVRESVPRQVPEAGPR